VGVWLGYGTCATIGQLFIKLGFNSRTHYFFLDFVHASSRRLDCTLVSFFW